jgi:hypothetical protein
MPAEASTSTRMVSRKSLTLTDSNLPKESLCKILIRSFNKAHHKNTQDSDDDEQQEYSNQIIDNNSTKQLLARYMELTSNLLTRMEELEVFLIDVPEIEEVQLKLVEQYKSILSDHIYGLFQVLEYMESINWKPIKVLHFISIVEVLFTTCDDQCICKLQRILLDTYSNDELYLKALDCIQATKETLKTEIELKDTLVMEQYTQDNSSRVRIYHSYRSIVPLWKEESNSIGALLIKAMDAIDLEGVGESDGMLKYLLDSLRTKCLEVLEWTRSIIKEPATVNSMYDDRVPGQLTDNRGAFNATLPVIPECLEEDDSEDDMSETSNSESPPVSPTPEIISNSLPPPLHIGSSSSKIQQQRPWWQLFCCTSDTTVSGAHCPPIDYPTSQLAKPTSMSTKSIRRSRKSTISYKSLHPVRTFLRSLLCSLALISYRRTGIYFILQHIMVTNNHFQRH